MGSVISLFPVGWRWCVGNGDCNRRDLDMDLGHRKAAFESFRLIQQDRGIDLDCEK